MKNIAIIGSSGGNLFNQGGSDPEAMIGEVRTQANSVGISVAYVQFICAASSMDNASDTTGARLYTIGLDPKGAASQENASSQGTATSRETVSSQETASGQKIAAAQTTSTIQELQAGPTTSLKEANIAACALDLELAAHIRNREIDGLMLLSCDPKHTNKEALTAAAEMQIPVVGTGGSSMADTQLMGCRVIAASGTTGTTNRTRAVSAISSFTKEWGIKYSPIIGQHGPAKQEGSVWKRINFKGIMMTSMPGFIAMALCLALSKIPGLSVLGDVFETLVGILPVIVAAVAAKQISGMDEVGTVAGIVAGVLAVDGGIIGGIIAGIIAGVLVYYISTFCFRHKVPGTTTNIAAGGLAGLAAGLIGMYAVAPLALQIGNGIKAAIDWALTYNPILAGAIAGFAIWFAIIGGVYHAAILPIVLLEMENAGFSFLGAIDLCGLVMVCAGIQLAYIIKPRGKGDRASAIPNIFVNLAFGTFVEAAYPFMFSCKKVFLSAIAAATLSGLCVGFFDVKCTAYVPCFMAPLMSNDKVLQTIICMVVALGSACVFTLLANIMDGKKSTEN